MYDVVNPQFLIQYLSQFMKKSNLWCHISFYHFEFVVSGPMRAMRASSSFCTVIYVCTGILPTKGVRGRVIVIDIACFERGFEKESPCARGEIDFDTSCTEHSPWLIYHLICSSLPAEGKRRVQYHAYQGNTGIFLAKIGKIKTSSLRRTLIAILFSEKLFRCQPEGMENV